MLDLMKEYLEAWSQRVRSPFGGYTIAAFLAINWREVFYLFFSDQPASIRIRFFDLNSSWVDLTILPLLFGGILAVGFPWLNYIVAFCIREPVGKHRKLQMTETISNRIHQIADSTRIEEAEAENERVRENRKIEQARRLEEARATGSEDLANSILEDREISVGLPDKLSETLNSLGRLEKAVVLKIGQDNVSWSQDRLKKDSNLRSEYDDFTFNSSSIRFDVDLKAAVVRLAQVKFLKTEQLTSGITLTDVGYRAFDILSKI